MERMPTGTSVSVFYLGDGMPGAAALRLAAAVVWRHAPYDPRGGARRWGRGPAAWLRRLRQRLWLRLGPLGLDVQVQWPGTRKHRSGGFAVTSVRRRADEEPRAYYDGRTVRLLGRDYEVPVDGRSLVLLVDEGGQRAANGRRPAAPRVVVRTVLVPSAPAPALPLRDRSSEVSAPGHETIDVRTDTVAGGGRPEWETALRADPEVRAFMEAGPDA